ncbi:hypothetical protein LEN26_013919 [Aphanomyces euteiches]|nr:hypothetical protein LEN26_013919 [Aphanomyces euteiches]
MHRYFDGICLNFPLFKLDVDSFETQPSVDGRYKVNLKVTALTHECKDDVFGCLKDGSAPTEDPLVMTTFVHVENPQVFGHCLEWKSKQIQKIWDDAYC